jgi:hypothetical protein
LACEGVEQDQTRDRRHVAQHDLVAGGVDAVDQPVSLTAELTLGLGLGLLLLVRTNKRGVSQRGHSDSVPRDRVFRRVL